MPRGRVARSRSIFSTRCNKNTTLVGNRLKRQARNMKSFLKIRVTPATPQLYRNGTPRRGRGHGLAPHPPGHGVRNARTGGSESQTRWRPAPAMPKLPFALLFCQSCTHPSSIDGSRLSLLLSTAGSESQQLVRSRASCCRAVEDLSGQRVRLTCLSDSA